jgi:Protein of unknown function (DUF1279)
MPTSNSVLTDLLAKKAALVKAFNMISVIRRCTAVVLLLVWAAVSTEAFSVLPVTTTTTTRFSTGRARPLALHAWSTKERDTTTTDDTVQKYGLEAGLFQSWRQGGSDGQNSAQQLLKKYGIAYLATSIPLAAVSFAICYVLVDNGIDVGALLQKVGIQAGDAADQAGTVAIAYAAHKAASPIRFPPTVILTPIVAKWIGKEPEAADNEENDSE